MAKGLADHNRPVSAIAIPLSADEVETMNAASMSEAAPAPLPEKIASLVHEARWLLVGLLGIYLALISMGLQPR
jgi:hypothetical protein